MDTGEGTVEQVDVLMNMFMSMSMSSVMVGAWHERAADRGAISIAFSGPLVVVVVAVAAPLPLLPLLL